MARVREIFEELAYNQARQGMVLLAALASSGAALILALILGAVVWMGLPAYFVPLGGPGLARPGVLEDALAVEYARRCLLTRWSWRPGKSHKEMATALLAVAHPTYKPTLESELELEARQVREYEAASQLVILHAGVLRRKGNMVLVQLQAQRTLYLGKQELPAQALTAEVLVLPWETEGTWGRRGTVLGLTVAQLATTPVFRLPPD